MKLARTLLGSSCIAPGAALLGQHVRGVVSFFHAPHTGGAHDSHRRTAGIAGRTRRRGGNLAARGARTAEAAARAAGRELNVFNASSESAIVAAFESLAKQGVGGLLIGTDTFFYSQRERIVVLATRHAVPAFYFAREFAVAGGLISYGPSFRGEWRQAGIYAGRILRGVKPADLPVTQPTRFERVINLKTAKALSLDIPPKLLALTDEVIE